jgi:hypothetical protein
MAIDMNIPTGGLLVFIWVLMAEKAIARSGDAWVESAWKCYSGSHSAAADVTKAETVTLETFSDNPPKPTFIAKPGDTPTKFLGLGLSPGMSISSEVITTYKGHAIYCFTCRHKLEADEPPWTFDWAVLAGDVTTGSDLKKVRVFFVEAGDEIRDFGAEPVSSGEGSPGIVASQDIDGNGVESDTWTLKFEKTGPWLVESEGHGRKEPLMTFHYNKAGKVIKVEREDDN